MQRHRKYTQKTDRENRHKEQTQTTEIKQVDSERGDTTKEDKGESREKKCKFVQQLSNSRILGENKGLEFLDFKRNLIRESHVRDE